MVAAPANVKYTSLDIRYLCAWRDHIQRKIIQSARTFQKGTAEHSVETRSS